MRRLLETARGRRRIAHAGRVGGTLNARHATLREARQALARGDERLGAELLDTVIGGDGLVEVAALRERAALRGGRGDFAGATDDLRAAAACSAVDPDDVLGIAASAEGLGQTALAHELLARAADMGDPDVARSAARRLHALEGVPATSGHEPAHVSEDGIEDLEASYTAALASPYAVDAVRAAVAYPIALEERGEVVAAASAWASCRRWALVSSPGERTAIAIREGDTWRMPTVSGGLQSFGDVPAGWVYAYVTLATPVPAGDHPLRPSTRWPARWCTKVLVRRPAEGHGDVAAVVLDDWGQPLLAGKWRSSAVRRLLADEQPLTVEDVARLRQKLVAADELRVWLLARLREDDRLPEGWTHLLPWPRLAGHALRIATTLNRGDNHRPVASLRDYFTEVAPELSETLQVASANPMLGQSLDDVPQLEDLIAAVDATPKDVVGPEAETALLAMLGKIRKWSHSALLQRQMTGAQLRRVGALAVRASLAMGERSADPEVRLRAAAAAGKIMEDFGGLAARPELLSQRLRQALTETTPLARELAATLPDEAWHRRVAQLFAHVVDVLRLDIELQLRAGRPRADLLPGVLTVEQLLYAALERAPAPSQPFTVRLARFALATAGVAPPEVAQRLARAADAALDRALETLQGDKSLTLLKVRLVQVLEGDDAYERALRASIAEHPVAAGSHLRLLDLFERDRGDLDAAKAELDAWRDAVAEAPPTMYARWIPPYIEVRRARVLANLAEQDPARYPEAVSAAVDAMLALPDSSRPARQLFHLLPHIPAGELAKATMSMARLPPIAHASVGQALARAYVWPQEVARLSDTRSIGGALAALSVPSDDAERQREHLATLLAELPDHEQGRAARLAASAAEALALRGRLQGDAQDRLRAGALFEALLTVRNRPALWLRWVAQVLAQPQDEDLDRLLERARELPTHNINVRLQRVTLELHAGHPEQAEKLLDDLASAPSYATGRVTWLRAETAAQLGRPAEARRLLRQLLSEHPENPKLQWHLGKALLQELGPAAAVSPWLTALRIQERTSAVAPSAGSTARSLAGLCLDADPAVIELLGAAIAHESIGVSARLIEGFATVGAVAPELRATVLAESEHRSDLRKAIARYLAVCSLHDIVGATPVDQETRRAAVAAQLRWASERGVLTDHLATIALRGPLRRALLRAVDGDQAELRVGERRRRSHVRAKAERNGLGPLVDQLLADAPPGAYAVGLALGAEGAARVDDELVVWVVRELARRLSPDGRSADRSAALLSQLAPALLLRDIPVAGDLQFHAAVLVDPDVLQFAERHLLTPEQWSRSGTRILRAGQDSASLAGPLARAGIVTVPGGDGTATFYVGGAESLDTTDLADARAVSADDTDTGESEGRDEDVEPVIIEAAGDSVLDDEEEDLGEHDGVPVTVGPTDDDEQ